MSSSPLTRVSSSKYLGVTVDGKVTAKATKTLGLIKCTLYPSHLLSRSHMKCWLGQS